MYSMNRSHQITNVSRVGDRIDLPKAPVTRLKLDFGNVRNRGTKLGGEKEIVLKEQHVRFDVEKTKSDSAVTEGIKSKRHTSSSRPHNLSAGRSF